MLPSFVDETEVARKRAERQAKKKAKAKAADAVSHEKGKECKPINFIPREWLSVGSSTVSHQDTNGGTSDALDIRIITWNVRNHKFFGVSSSSLVYILLIFIPREFIDVGSGTRSTRLIPWIRFSEV